MMLSEVTHISSSSDSSKRPKSEKPLTSDQVDSSKWPKRETPFNAVQVDSPKRSKRETPFKSDLIDSSKKSKRETPICRVRSLEEFYDLDTWSPQKEFINCFDINSCKGNCGSVLQGLMEYQCQCDDLCWFHGDCCYDYYKLCLRVDIRAGNRLFLKTILSRLQNYRQVLQYHTELQWAMLSTCRLWVSNGVRIVDRCGKTPDITARFRDLHQKTNMPGANLSHFPVGMLMSEIRERCENFNASSNNNNLIHDIVPVTLELGSRLFYFLNVFCSLCNGVPLNGIKFFTTKITCKGSVAVVLTDLFYTWSPHLSDVLSNRTCLVESDLPLKDRTSCFHRPDRCEQPDSSHGYVEVANQSTKNYPLSRKHVAEVCGLYLLPITDNPLSLHFKNPHCYHCYYLKERFVNDYNSPNKTKCLFKCYGSYVPVTPMSGFTFLFDFRSRIKVMTVEDDSVVSAIQPFETQHKFAFLFEKSKVVCRNDHMVLARKCVRLLYWRSGDGFFNTSGTLRKFNLSSFTFRKIEMSIKYRYLLKAQSDDPSKSQVEFLSEEDPNVQERGHDYGRYSLQRITEIWEFSILRDYVKPLTDASRTLSEAITNIISTKLQTRFNGSIHIFKSRVCFKSSSKKCVDLSEIITDPNSIDSESNSVSNSSDFFSTHTYDVESSATSEGNDYDTDIQLVLYYGEPNHFRALLEFVAEFAPKWVEIGHSENFKFTEVKLSSAHSIESNMSFEQPCDPDRELKHMLVPITLDEFGEFVFSVDDGDVPNEDFGLQLILSFNEYTGDAKIDRVVLPLCKRRFVNLTALECPSSVYMHFTIFDFILFNGFLIVSTIVGNTSNITEILTHTMDHGKNYSVIEVLLNVMPEEEFYMYEKDSYVLTDKGAIVCSTYHTLQGNTTGRISRDRKVVVFIDTSIVERYLSLAASLLTIVCLILVLVVYGVLSELRKNVPGKIILSLSASLLAAHLMFIFSQSLENLACEIYALVHHAAWLASFAWLAFMATHLAHTLQFPTTETDDAGIFYKRSFLCWGLPCLWASACFIFDKTNIFSMDYGKMGPCWIGDNNAMLFTFGIPVFISLTTSLTSSCIVIRSITKSVRFRRKNSRNVGYERHQLFLCCNLTLLMSLSWVSNFIVLVADIPYLWILHDLAHGCEGLFILLCFVARKSLLTKLLQRLRTPDSV